MQIRVCRYKNVGVVGYAEAFMPVQSDLQTSEWYSYFENDVLASEGGKQSQKVQQFSGKYAII
ncbi:hypothetical protein DXA93_08570 [Blautia sp. OF09-25XD]|mgnify:FL=1|jgi:hypothetical protein|nr:hypothetical protein DXA93_08570 [Blautia sp. OF09-25XD]